MLAVAGVVAAGRPLIAMAANKCVQCPPTTGPNPAMPKPVNGLFNVVINGPLGVAFRPDNILVFAPETPDSHNPGRQEHSYRLDCCKWIGDGHELKGVVAGSKKSPADYGINANDTLVIDSSTNAFDANKKPFASIVLPYPDSISQLRAMKVQFQDNKANKTETFGNAAGALVLEYKALSEFPSITGSDWRPCPDLKWLLLIHVSASIDDSLEHAQGAWTQLQSFFGGVDKTLTSSSENKKQRPANSGLTSKDIEAFEKKDCATHNGPKNCKAIPTIISNVGS
jgi:hypothetical protein